MAQLVEFGLNKLERLRHEAADGKALPLDPDFPFIAMTNLPQPSGGGWTSPRNFPAHDFEAHISIPGAYSPDPFE
jgi:hypothetical protein